MKSRQKFNARRYNAALASAVRTNHQSEMGSIDITRRSQIKVGEVPIVQLQFTPPQPEGISTRHLSPPITGLRTIYNDPAKQ
jgi:hypothetical protein